MAELNFMKGLGGVLMPMEPDTEEYIKKLSLGAVISGDFKKLRNPKFHRKVFALFGLAFDIWDAPQLEYKGQPVQKNFDRFRKDMTILAGYYDVVVNFKNEVRYEAKSLSFGSMEDLEFLDVYKAVLNVIWDRVLSSKGYENPEAVDEIVNKLLEFDK